jgi:uncharacterized membrane protein
MENRLSYWLETLLPKSRVRRIMASPGMVKTTRAWEALRKHWLNEPAYVVLGYLVLGILVLRSEGSVFQALLAAGLSLFGLGFSITYAIAPLHSYFGKLERLALSAYLSLAVGGLLGFALSRTPWGLRIDTLLVSTLLLNLVCYFTVVYRRRKIKSSVLIQRQNAYDTGQAWLAWWRAQERSSLGVTLALVVLLVVGGMALTQNMLAPAVNPAMTEFYILNQDMQIDEFSPDLTPGEVFDINFGITNLEGRAAIYSVRAEVSGEQVGLSHAILLESGDTFLGTLKLEVPHGSVASGEAIKVDLSLYKNEEVHRSLYIWFEVE